MGGRNSTQSPVEEEVVVPVRSDGACSALFMDAGLLRRRRNDILRRLSLSTVEEGGEPPRGRGGWARGAKDWLWRYAPLLLHLCGITVVCWLNEIPLLLIGWGFRALLDYIKGEAVSPVESGVGVTEGAVTSTALRLWTNPFYTGDDL